MITVGDTTLKYISSGMFRNENPWIHTERVIDSFEIIILLKNEVFISEEQKEYHLSEGDVLLLEPFKKHYGSRISENGCSFYWLHLSINSKEAIDFKYFNINNTTQKDNILFFMSQIIHVAELEQYKAETADALCYALLQYLSVANNTHFDKSDKLIYELMEYVRINNDKPLTVRDIANYFSYNADYISLVFKNKTGIGLKEYLNNKTIHYAKNLLVTSNYSVKEIGAILKFNTPQSFISFFKYHEKTSPLKYRNRNIGVHYNNY